MSKTNFKVDGIAVYARVHTPNPKADNSYTLDLVVDDATAKELESIGVKPARKEQPDGSKTLKSHENLGFKGTVFSFSRKTVSKAGNKLDPLQVVDSLGRPMTDLIGHGSKVRVYGNTYDTEFKGRSMVGKSMNTVQVIDLVQYNNVDIITGGYTSTTDTTTTTTEPKNDMEGYI